MSKKGKPVKSRKGKTHPIVKVMRDGVSKLWRNRERESGPRAITNVKLLGEYLKWSAHK